MIAFSLKPGLIECAVLMSVFWRCLCSLQAEESSPSLSHLQHAALWNSFQVSSWFCRNDEQRDNETPGQKRRRLTSKSRRFPAGGFQTCCCSGPRWGAPDLENVSQTSSSGTGNPTVHDLITDFSHTRKSSLLLQTEIGDQPDSDDERGRIWRGTTGKVWNSRKTSVCGRRSNRQLAGERRRRW